MSSRANAFARQLEKRLADAKPAPHHGDHQAKAHQAKGLQAKGLQGEVDQGEVDQAEVDQGEVDQGEVDQGEHMTFDGVVALPHTEDGAP